MPQGKKPRCWTTEWPKEEGYYWMFGWRYGAHIGRQTDPEMLYVEVRLLQSSVPGEGKVPVYITGGISINASDGARGVWMRVKWPPVPNFGQKTPIRN